MSAIYLLISFTNTMIVFMSFQKCQAQLKTVNATQMSTGLVIFIMSLIVNQQNKYRDSTKVKYHSQFFVLRSKVHID